MGEKLPKAAPPTEPEVYGFGTPQLPPKSHIETLIIYKLRSRKFNTQNDLYY